MLGVLLIVSLTAPPEPPGGIARAVESALVVDAGSTCLEPTRLAEQVRTWLELDEVDERLVVEVRGDPEEPTRVSFTILLDGDVAAVRRFDSAPKACADLHAVIGLAIALALDATVLEAVGVADRSEEESEPPPVPEPRPIPRPEPDRTDDRAEVSAPPRDWSMRLSAEGGLSLGAPPGVGGQAAAFVEAGWRDRLDLRLGAQGGSSGEQPAIGGRILLWALGGRADVCVGGRLRIVRPRACGGVLLGGAVARGRGFLEDRAARLPWLALPLGGDLRLKVTERLELELGAEMLVNAIRPAFDFVDASGFRQVGRAFPRVAATFGLGAVVTVW